MSVSNPLEAWLTAWAMGVNASTQWLEMCFGGRAAAPSTFSMPFLNATGAWPVNGASWLGLAAQSMPMHALGANGWGWPSTSAGPFSGAHPALQLWQSLMPSPWQAGRQAWSMPPSPWATIMPWAATVPAPANAPWDPMGMMKAWPSMVPSASKANPRVSADTWPMDLALKWMTASWAPFLGASPEPRRTPPPTAPAGPFRADDPFGLSAATKMWLSMMPGHAPAEPEPAPKPEPRQTPALPWPWSMWMKLPD